MQSGDYCDLCFVAYDPPVEKHDMFIAPPWTVKTGDKVLLPDGKSGIVETLKTVPYGGEDYEILLKVSRTVCLQRLKGIITFQKFQYKDTGEDKTA
jgi:hypothetical protein